MAVEIPAGADRCTIAIDESGRHGPNLTAGGHFVLGSTSLDDAAASSLLSSALGRPAQAAEWKWRKLRDHPQMVEALLDSLDDSTVLSCAVHHRFFAWTKAVDTLLYEYEYYLLDQASISRQFQMPWLANQSWEAVRTFVDPFLEAYVQACRIPNEKTFYWLTRHARTLAAECKDTRIKEEILRPMAVHSERFKELLLDHVALLSDDGGPFDRHADHIDPHINALGTMAMGWRSRGVPTGHWIDALHDEINPKDVVERWSGAFVDLHKMVLRRGKSSASSAIQLADLVAGATSMAFGPPTTGAAEDVRALLLGRVPNWIPEDLTIWALRDPGSQARPEKGNLRPRTDFDH